MSDNGFWLKDVSELDVENYGSVSASETKLLFITANGTGSSIEEIIDHLSVNNSEYISDNKKIVAKSFSLDEFINQESTNGVIETYKSFCQANKIEL
ncbi:MAG: hypothetical protein PQJ59_02355 [Spirochaetales bacterium]|nr:hypothetical protein [Spirochaetales bacterium]